MKTRIVQHCVSLFKHWRSLNDVIWLPQEKGVIATSCLSWQAKCLNHIQAMEGNRHSLVFVGSCFLLFYQKSGATFGWKPMIASHRVPDKFILGSGDKHFLGGLAIIFLSVCLQLSGSACWFNSLVYGYSCSLGGKSCWLWHVSVCF